MKVLHVAESIKGGVGTYLNHLVPLQIGEFGGGAVRVIVPAQHRVQVPQIPPENVIEFDRPDRSARSLCILGAHLVQQVREFEPDVIHAQSTFAGAIVRLLCGRKRGRPRIVYCPHGWVFKVENGWMVQRGMELAERLLSHFCDAIVAISQHERNEACRIGIEPRKVVIISNGIAAVPPSPMRLPWHDPRLRVLFVGRLDRQKGFDLLCRAVEGLERQVHVRIVGEAIHRGRSHAFVLPTNVELLGWRSEAEIHGLLQEADVLIMPSRWEGFGLVAIEAMRAGCPVFAAGVGGLPELVKNGSTGRLFLPNNVESLRKTILSTDRGELEFLGQEGRRRFLELFTIQHTHANLASLYRDLVGIASDGGFRSHAAAPVSAS